MWIKVLAVLLIISIAFVVIRQFALLISNDSVLHLRCAANDRCRIGLNNGKVYQANIISADWLFNYFALILLQSNSKKFKVIISKDAVSQEQFYTLRLYLRSLNN